MKIVKGTIVGWWQQHQQHWNVYYYYWYKSAGNNQQWRWRWLGMGLLQAGHKNIKKATINWWHLQESREADRGGGVSTRRHSEQFTVSSSKIEIVWILYLFISNQNQCCIVQIVSYVFAAILWGGSTCLRDSPLVVCTPKTWDLFFLFESWYKCT